MARLVVSTHLSSEEVFRRIAAATFAWPLFQLERPGDSFFAKTRPPGLVLTRGRILFSFPNGEIFRGHVIEEAGHTRIYGRLGLPASVLILLSMIIGFPLPTLAPSVAARHFEVLLPLSWLVAFCFLRFFAWDYGGAEDPYSTFLVETLRDSGPARPRIPGPDDRTA